MGRVCQLEVTVFGSIGSLARDMESEGPRVVHVVVNRAEMHATLDPLGRSQLSYGNTFGIRNEDLFVVVGVIVAILGIAWVRSWGKRHQRFQVS